MKSFKQFVVQEEYENYYRTHEETGLTREQHKHFEDYHKTLTPQQENAMWKYKNYSNDFNSSLRNPNKEKFEKEQPVVAAYLREKTDLLKTVTSHQIPHDMTVYRGFGNKVNIHKMEPGEHFVDKGFTGTTTDPSWAKFYSHSEHQYNPENNGVYINHHHYTKIHVPKGTKGHFFDIKKNPIAEENEFVLHPGTKFEVIKHESEMPTDLHNRYHVTHLRVVGQE